MPIDNRGSKNPFFGRKHSPESIEKMRQARKGKALGNQNAKGYKHTPEDIEKIRQASLRLWRDQRQKMVLAHGAFPENMNSKSSIRERKTEFNITDRKRWLKDKCEWCESTENLELDHIIPRLLGGPRTEQNAQTLCHPCNVWKHNHVDLPQWRSLLGRTGDN